MPQTHLSHFSQHRANHSTETLLLRVTNDLLMACDQGSVSILSLLDLSAAFDTLDHNILLKRLRLSFGISGVVLRWLESYLTERNQTVLAGGRASQPTVLKYGVPQGSVLGPVLFTMYITPLGHVIRHHKTLYHLFADERSCTNLPALSTSLNFCWTSSLVQNL